MGYGMCSTGQHLAWMSVGRFRSWTCDCPPFDPPLWKVARPTPVKKRRHVSIAVRPDPMQEVNGS